MVTTRAVISRDVRRPPRRRWLPSALALVLAAGVWLDASTPRFFRAGTQAEFLRGDLQQLAVDSRGELRLGLAMDLVYETSAPFVWSVLDAGDGAMLVGTGSEGRVFRVDAQGNASVFFDADELEVHAMTAAPDGGFFVATSPDGRIYKLDRTGAATVFFEPGQRYIWALAMDPSGNLIAATGEQSGIYRIAPDGTGAVFYQPPATHATALAFDQQGRLYVGTEAPGRVLRVDNEGRGFTLLDSPHTEISAMRFDANGTLYVAAVSGAGAAASSPPPSTSTGGGGDTASGRAPIPVVTTEVTVVGVGSADSGAGTSPSTQGGGQTARGAVYRIAPDGLWDEIWQAREDTPYDLAFDAENRVIVGTGAQGRVFRLEGDPLQATLLSRASAQQVTVLHGRPGGPLYVATANPGKLFRLSATSAAEGTYESEVLDAQIVARWGAISWRGSVPSGTSVRVRTRSGNTQTPDASWSDWSAPYATPSGSPIASPNARFLQWQAVLSGKGDGPVLTSITAAYLQRNMRPRVQTFSVHPPGIVFQQPFTSGEPDLAGFIDQSTPDRRLAVEASNQGSGTTLGRRTYQRGLQTFIWRADDENGDTLRSSLYYRREGEANWTPLREDLDESIFVWNTATVPDGTYFVRLVASDRSSNASEQALSGEYVSQAFDIDNTAPAVTVQDVRIENGVSIVALEASDTHSNIQRVEYSQDGLSWSAAFPVDGIADSRTEQFEIRVTGMDARGLSLRAIDTMNNTTAAHAAP
ncbi:MAG: SMP-30/gluconolactonase/LRE family protein [Vicinamibacterales bacterium]